MDPWFLLALKFLKLGPKGIDNTAVIWPWKTMSYGDEITNQSSYFVTTWRNYPTYQSFQNWLCHTKFKYQIFKKHYLNSIFAYNKIRRVSIKKDLLFEVVTNLWYRTKLEDLTVPNGHIKRNAISYLKTSRTEYWELRLTLAHKNYCVVTVVLYRRKLELKNALNRWSVKVLAKIPSTLLTKNKDCAHLNHLCVSKNLINRKK